MCQKALWCLLRAARVSVRGAQLNGRAASGSSSCSSNYASNAASAGDCGTPLTYEAPDGIAIAAGAFDDPAAPAACHPVWNRGQDRVLSTTCTSSRALPKRTPRRAPFRCLKSSPISIPITTRPSGRKGSARGARLRRFVEGGHAARFAIAPPVSFGYPHLCHCRMCQKGSRKLFHAACRRAASGLCA